MPLAHDTHSRTSTPYSQEKPTVIALHILPEHYFSLHLQNRTTCPSQLRDPVWRSLFNPLTDAPEPTQYTIDVFKPFHVHQMHMQTDLMKHLKDNTLWTQNVYSSAFWHSFVGLHPYDNTPHTPRQQQQRKVKPDRPNP